MKKLLSIILFLMVWVVVPHALAQTTNPSGFVALAPIPGLTDVANTSAINSASLANFFNNLYKYLIGLAAIIAIIEIIWGGLLISTQDSVSKHEDGKEKIQQAILGLVLVLAPVIVFSIINPSILNLSLNLPMLDTAPNTQIPTTVTPSNSGGTSNFLTPTGTLSTCANNDCTAAVAACNAQNTTGFSATANVVCVTGSGQEENSASPATGASGVCPANDQKEVDCTTISYAGG